MESKKQPQHTFASGGLAIAGSIVLGNQIMGIANMAYASSTVIPLAITCAAGGITLDLLLREKKYEKLFRNCGIINTAGQVPLIIKKTKKDHETTLVLHLPEGLSQKHFELKQQELEQSLNCKIEFGFNKNLVMKLINMNLSNMYPYTFEQCDKPLEIFAGYTHSGKFYLDLEKCPHAIVSGETDSGKSSLLDVITLSLILSKHNTDLHLIDFQAVTLGKYESCKKVKSYGETPQDFDKLMDEMAEENEKRLKLFRSVKGKAYVDKLSTWNELYPGKALSRKVVIIDEFTRLAEKEYEDILEKFRSRVSMDRKVGIHYISSLQRPDVKCISGSIKANMPTRIAFRTVTDTDSEVILDQKGAEKLTEKGRFLAKYCGKLTEVQGLYADLIQVWKLLKQYKAYKTVEEIQLEKKDDMKKLRDKCINPYLKGV